MEDLAGKLRFERSEINNIRATNAYGAPFCYLRTVIDKWTHWAPDDARGSEDFATLERLKVVVRDMAILRLLAKLTLEDSCYE